MSNVVKVSKSILLNLNTGTEQSVNGALFFGNGSEIYMYADIAKQIGFVGVERTNKLFVTVLGEQLKAVLRGIHKLDGYLEIE